MKKLFVSIFTIGVFFMLFGCGSVTTDAYKNTNPKFTLKGFFDGNIEGYGYYQTRSGKVDIRYYVAMEASWNGDEGVLKEKFFMDDGKENSREWKIKIIDDHNFTATAADVEGTAIGKIEGHAMNMKYTLIIDRDGSKVSVNMDDWIYLMPDGSAMNRAFMSKFGIALGEVSFSFQKLKKGEKFKTSFYIGQNER